SRWQAGRVGAFSTRQGPWTGKAPPLTNPSGGYSSSLAGMLASMARPPAARSRALDAFARILVSHGERAATLEAVAEAAEISKGGLLYHFASKDELVAGLVERLRELIVEDVAEMNADPQGPTSYILRTSAEFDTEFEQVYIAVVTLAQSGHAEARR